jgi:hypothetical protein
MHEKIKNQIKDAMRAKDTVRLEVLRGLSALFTNELLKKDVKKSAGKSKSVLAPILLPDDEVTVIIRKSVKQRKDSIEQFGKGGRKDLVKKEQAELVILESFLAKMMGQEEIEKFIQKKIKTDKIVKIDKAKIGQFIGQIMKELKGKADGSDVKAVVEKLSVAAKSDISHN